MHALVLRIKQKAEKVFQHMIRTISDDKNCRYWLKSDFTQRGKGLLQVIRSYLQAPWISDEDYGTSSSA
jgi:hypothetical protein